jgi:hypothetical protein
MSALAISGLVFGCVFGGALIGMFLNAGGIPTEKSRAEAAAGIAGRRRGR